MRLKISVLRERQSSAYKKIQMFFFSTDASVIGMFMCTDHQVVRVHFGSSGFISGLPDKDGLRI